MILSQYDRSSPGSLESDHPRHPGNLIGGAILRVPLPIGSDITRIPHREVYGERERRLIGRRLPIAAVFWPSIRNGSLG